MKELKGFELVQSTVRPNVSMVRVDADVLLCDGGKLLPYPTYIGTIDRVTGRSEVWSPAASKPRGYRAAAKRVLEEIAAEIIE